MTLNPNAIAEYQELLGDDFGPFFIDLIDTFFQSSENHIIQIKNALASNDIETFTRAAHTLKSSSKTFGADTLSDLAFELEQLGNQGNIQGASEKVAELELEYQKIIVELQDLRTFYSK